MIHFILGAGVFLADLAAKAYVEEQPEDRLPRKILRGRATLCRSHNKGMMLNFLEDKPETAARASTAAGVLALLHFLPLLFRRKRKQSLEKLGGALILGGAASNISDHWRRGYVVDYLKFPWKPIENVAFNLGDLAIFTGCLLTILGHTEDKPSKRTELTEQGAE